MVIVPVVATLAMAEPLIMPISAEAITATLAGPPGVWPTSVSAMSLMNWENPLYLRNAPKSTNTKIYVAETPAPVPSTPLVSHTSALITRLSVKALVPNVPGMYLPHTAKYDRKISAMMARLPLARRAASNATTRQTTPTHISVLFSRPVLAIASYRMNR